MSECIPVRTASGQIVAVAPQNSQCTQPPAFREALAGVVAANALLISLANPLPNGTFFPDGWFLPVLNTTTGVQTSFQISQNFLVTDAVTTDIPIVGDHDGFAAGDVVFSPIELGGRESISSNTSGQRATSVTAANKGATGGVTTSHNTTVDLSGDYEADDIAALNIRNSLQGITSGSEDVVNPRYTNPRRVYLWIIDSPSEGTANTHGEVEHGVYDLTGTSKAGTTTSIIKNNITAEVSGHVKYAKESANPLGYFGIQDLP